MPSRDPWMLSPRLRELLARHAALCEQAGFTLLVTCTYRSRDEQDALYAQGRTLPGRIVTQLRGGQSKHNHTAPNGEPSSLAYDAAPMVSGKVEWDASINGLWQRMGELGVSLGLIWGGRWRMRDLPHFELPSIEREG